MFAGIDIGSSSSKAAIIGDDGRLLSVSVHNQGAGTDGHRQALERALALAGAERSDIRFLVATGYGRMRYEGADRQLTEISCHAKGVAWLTSGARTIIDVGGQDSKAIKLDAAGNVANFAMNEKCAAGTGRFLEVMARVLDCRVDELSEIAAASVKEVPISSVCAVFAESEVISRLSSGERPEDVARGAHVSIARRIAGLAGRIGCQPEIVMTGGVALNGDAVACLSKELGHEVLVAPHAQAIGAVGAAAFAWEMARAAK
ncbi:MAG: acyl-CoA dehydratase activase [Clostridiales Family XIII bacterium]|jgi:predicted CoA-substrate-specific enzyme activase|nr:acyl-CoA dehydratase activase [Clostridiales Family XIII bacterium]